MDVNEDGDAVILLGPFTEDMGLSYVEVGVMVAERYTSNEKALHFVVLFEGSSFTPDFGSGPGGGGGGFLVDEQGPKAGGGGEHYD